MANKIYECKDGRARIYIQEEKRVMSYPKYLMELELGRPLLPNEDVHHKDGNPLNNDLSNLELRNHGEHQAEHSRKYSDVTTFCRWCGKEILWTARQQRTFNGNRQYEGKSSTIPFCSPQCSGKYGRQMQLDIGSDRRRLTDDQVTFIRTKYIPYDKEYGARALGAKFNVNRSAIDLIIKRKTYKDVP